MENKEQEPKYDLSKIYTYEEHPEFYYQDLNSKNI
jgi:hypothetical protein